MVRAFSERDTFLSFINNFPEIKNEIISLFDLNSESYLKKFKSIYFVFTIDTDDFTSDRDILAVVGVDIPKKAARRNVFLDIYINPKYRGMGYAYTVLSDLLNYICSYIKEHLNKKTIHATVDKSNEASIKALKKALSEINNEKI